MHLDQHELRRALGYFEAAWEIWRTLGDRGDEATVLLNVGAIHQHLEEWDTAIDKYRAALKICRDTNDHLGTATSLLNLGTVYDNIGEQESGLAMFTEALGMQEALEIDCRLDGPNQERDKAALERVKEKLGRQT